MRFGCGDGSMENKKRYPPFSCQMRIDKALSEAVHLPLNSCSRYIIISDCHRGEGGANDNFLRNQHLTGKGRISFLIFHASIPASETHVSNTTEADSIKIKDGQV